MVLKTLQEVLQVLKRLCTQNYYGAAKAFLIKNPNETDSSWLLQIQQNLKYWNPYNLNPTPWCHVQEELDKNCCNSCQWQPKIDRYMCSISSCLSNREAIILTETHTGVIHSSVEIHSRIWWVGQLRSPYVVAALPAFTRASGIPITGSKQQQQQSSKL